MPLTKDQVKEILKYDAFKNYDEEQKNALSQLLLSNENELSLAQVALLFGNDVNGGLVHSLVEESQTNEQAAKQLAKMITNVSESINPTYEYAPKPFIYNLIHRLGPYNDNVAQMVITLVQNHVDILKGRVLKSEASNPAHSLSNTNNSTNTFTTNESIEQGNSNASLLMFAVQNSNFSIIEHLSSHYPQLLESSLSATTQPEVEQSSQSQTSSSVNNASNESNTENWSYSPLLLLAISNHSSANILSQLISNNLMFEEMFTSFLSAESLPSPSPAANQPTQTTSHSSHTLFNSGSRSNPPSPENNGRYCK